MRIVFFLFFLFARLGYTQQLSVSSIPDSLRDGAKAVIRYDSTWFKVLSPEKSSLTRKYAVTILSGEKIAMSKIYLPYDQFCVVKNVKARILDKYGKQIKEIRKKDMEDIGLFDGISLASDNRAIYLNLMHHTYPYTIELSYDEQHTGTMFYPYWMPVSDYRISLERAYFQVEYPAQNPIRYRERNIHSKKVDNTQTAREWEVIGFRSLESEPYSPGLTELAPQVLTAPSFFQMDGYSGSMDSWRSYGDWINQLNAGRDQIPVPLKEKVIAITDTISTNTGKIAAVYDFLQQNTRYISIQLGIGGWQPFSASFVYEKSYGDCKALSNYTKALLQAIEIPSNYTLVRAGDREDMIMDFPNAWFNHAILCVPNEGDTIWLECTNQTNPVGYQGTFTGNRHALVINETGGHVAQTTFYDTEENVRSVKGTIKLGEEGRGEIVADVKLDGLQIESGGFRTAVGRLRKDQEEWLKDYFEFKSTTFSDFGLQLVEQPLQMPGGTIKAEFSADNLYTISGNRLLLNPNLFSRFSSVSLPNTERKTSIQKKYGYVQVDTLEFELPRDFYPELLPEEAILNGEFGSYKRTFKINESKLIYVREFRFNSGKYPPSMYPDFVEFIKNVIRKDNEKVIFLNKT